MWLFLIRYLAGEFVDGHDVSPQGKACLALMFWTSISLERAAGMMFFPTEAPQSNSPEGVYWQNGDEPLVRLYSPGPPLRTETTDVKAAQVHPVTHYSHIPLTSHACDVLRNYVTTSASDLSATMVRTAPESDVVAQIRAHLRKTLGSLNKQHGCRLSLGGSSIS